MTELQCAAVSVRRGGVHALRDVSMRVGAGEVVGLIGPNGAGKTTLLDVLSGFLQPQAGTVHLGDQDITGLAPWRRAKRGLQRTFQGSRLFGALSVAENVEVAALSTGARRREAVVRARTLLQRLDLDGLWDRRCRGLPQGVTQRIVLARALATRPAFLLLDEPAAGLSEAETADFEGLVHAACDDGTGVLVVEHDMRFVESVCGRAYVLADGQQLFDGTVAQTFASPVVQAAYLGNPLDPEPQEVD